MHEPNEEQNSPMVPHRFILLERKREQRERRRDRLKKSMLFALLCGLSFAAVWLLTMAR